MENKERDDGGQRLQTRRGGVGVGDMGHEGDDVGDGGTFGMVKGNVVSLSSHIECLYQCYNKNNVLNTMIKCL